MDLKKISFCVFLITLFTGCSQEDLSDPITYEVILEGHLSYSDRAVIPEQYLFFKNENDWNNFLPQIERVNPFTAENLENLNFDFNENNLIIIIGKYYNTCCSMINVNGVYKRNENIVVKYKESGIGELQAVSQAYILLKISK